MDGKKTNITKKVAEDKTNWTERMNKDNIGSINEKREMIMARYEKAFDILKGFEIKSEADLEYILKPLDDLEAGLKYIPNGQLFNDVIPTELKDNIFNYLCDSNAFIATAVCQEWKKTLEKRFKDKKVIVGEECSNCEDSVCVEAKNMFKAAATVRDLDTHLVVSTPIAEEAPKIITRVTEVDPKIITDGLTNISRFTIQELTFAPTLSDGQMEHLFKSIEMEEKVIEEVNLIYLDLNNLNQQTLANCLSKKIKRVTIELYSDVGVSLLFLRKIREDPANVKLTHLTLIGDFSLDQQFETSSPTGLADALCNIENVKLSEHNPFPSQTLDRIFENILLRTVKIKTLIIELDKESVYVFGLMIVPQNLITLLNKMETLHLEGIFTPEQMEAVRSLPDVRIGQIPCPTIGFFNSITKGSNRML